MKTKVALSCVILLTLLLYVHSCSNNNYLTDTNTLLQKKITRITNEKGEETAKKKSLVIQNKSLLKDLKRSEALEKNLRDQIKRSTVAGFNAKTVTVYNPSVRTDSIIIKDSLFPVYFASDSSKWLQYRITASKDSVRLDGLKIRNEITGVFNENRHIFKENEITLELTNHNPYTTTSDMQSFTYKPKPKKIGLGVMIGYGVSANGLSPFIGVGVSYSLIRIRPP